MPKSKQKPAATHWHKIAATPEEQEIEILDRLEEMRRPDIVLRLHGLEVDDLFRIDTPKCWCPESAPIEKPSDRMQMGNQTFFCSIHKRPISVRRSLDQLMKSPAKRAETLLESPELRGIRDQLYLDFFCFEAGEYLERRAINRHMPTSWREVHALPDAPARGVVLQAINERVALRAFDNGLEGAPWREDLQKLIDRDGDLEIGWHGGPLTGEEQHRRDVSIQREQHRAFTRDLRRREAERLNAEIEALK